LPWSLEPVSFALEHNGMAEKLGLSLPRQPDLAGFSRELKVLVWAPERLL
jgi:hypothetical protein